MAVLHDYKCMAHGKFESRKAVCPYGCTTVQRLVSAPAVHTGGRTAGIDSTLRRIADKHGFTNMTNSNGKSVGANMTTPTGDGVNVPGGYKDSAGGTWTNFEKDKSIVQQLGGAFDPSMSMSGMLGQKAAEPQKRTSLKGRDSSPIPE
jgi:hypothetical protein